MTVRDLEDLLGKVQRLGLPPTAQVVRSGSDHSYRRVERAVVGHAAVPRKGVYTEWYDEKDGDQVQVLVIE